MRCALLGPTPGSLPSSSMRSCTAPSYTRRAYDLATHACRSAAAPGSRAAASRRGPPRRTSTESPASSSAAATSSSARSRSAATRDDRLAAVDDRRPRPRRRRARAVSSSVTAPGAVARSRPVARSCWRWPQGSSLTARAQCPQVSPVAWNRWVVDMGARLSDADRRAGGLGRQLVVGVGALLAGEAGDGVHDLVGEQAARPARRASRQGCRVDRPAEGDPHPRQPREAARPTGCTWSVPTRPTGTTGTPGGEGEPGDPGAALVEPAVARAGALGVDAERRAPPAARAGRRRATPAPRARSAGRRGWRWSSRRSPAGPPRSRPVPVK